MAKTKTKAEPESKASITAAYLAKGLKYKEVGKEKKPVSDSENPLFKEYKAKLAALRRPIWAE